MKMKDMDWAPIGEDMGAWKVARGIQLTHLKSQRFWTVTEVPPRSAQQSAEADNTWE